MKIESNREMAYALGWLIRSYDDLDIPVTPLAVI